MKSHHQRGWSTPASGAHGNDGLDCIGVLGKEVHAMLGRKLKGIDDEDPCIIDAEGRLHHHGEVVKTRKGDTWKLLNHDRWFK